MQNWAGSALQRAKHLFSYLVWPPKIRIIVLFQNRPSTAFDVSGNRMHDIGLLFGVTKYFFFQEYSRRQNGVTKYFFFQEYSRRQNGCSDYNRRGYRIIRPALHLHRQARVQKGLRELEKKFQNDLDIYGPIMVGCESYL